MNDDNHLFLVIIEGKLKKIHIYILLLGLAFTIGIKAQDAQFSQFYSNPLYLAPSFAGAVDGSRITMNYRRQWWELGIPFYVASASYDHYFETFNSGVGILYLEDKVGTSELGSKVVSVLYSYNLEVFNIWHLRPGLSFSYLEHGFDGDLYFIDDVISGSTSAPSQSLDKTRDIDAGSSLLIYTYDLWFGATVDHLLEPNISLYSGTSTVQMKTQVYGGWTFRKKGKLLKPSDETMTVAFLYKEQAEVRQFDIGVYWHNYPIVLGLWYRGIPVLNSERGDALVFLAGLKTHNFNIGYSYDFTISNLLPYTLGSHEISIAYKFLLPERQKKGAVPCPEF